MGDPAGVGPEVCLQLLADRRVADFAIPVILGDAEISVSWQLYRGAVRAASRRIPNR
jgi:4-hydroxy-L-threonine phosphate dehydrogenase PdxA